jgi:hypothetical protein
MNYSTFHLKIQKYGLGTRDPEKTYADPGSKRHRIPDPKL